MDGDHVFPGQRQRAGRGSGRVEELLAEVAGVDPSSPPGQAVRDLPPEGRATPACLTALQMPLQLLPPGKGLLTELAEEL